MNTLSQSRVDAVISRSGSPHDASHLPSIERIQRRAYRIIFSEEDYEHVLQKNKFDTLEERRKAHCVKLISDLAQEDH